MNVVSLYQLIYVHPPPLHTTKWFNSIWLRNISTWLYHKYAIVLSLYIWLLKLFCEFNFDIISLYFWKMLPKYLTFFLFLFDCYYSIYFIIIVLNRLKVFNCHSTTVIKDQRNAAVIILRYTTLRYTGLWEVIHVSPFALCSSRSCHLHVDFTSELSCWPCIILYNINYL